jgi:hypothetical protein
MENEGRKRKPGALIAMGICFIGAGGALVTALSHQGAHSTGIGLVGVGVVLLALGLRMKREEGKAEGLGGGA